MGESGIWSSLTVIISVIEYCLFLFGENYWDVVGKEAKDLFRDPLHCQLFPLGVDGGDDLRLKECYWLVAGSLFLGLLSRVLMTQRGRVDATSLTSHKCGVMLPQPTPHRQNDLHLLQGLP
ncbi:hypothetical protein EDC04DRAFT_354456 [Pisolithus marmoratus]|nr:hypothetical protein EDC04DRAFT_354456 [Pisolithus marmoratus]